MRKHIFVLAVLVSCGLTLNAGLINLGPGSFTPLAPVITFSEQAMGTVNPVYSFTAIPGLGDVTVSFAGAFAGQTVVGGGVKTLTGTPTNPLTLNTSVQSFIADDPSTPTTPTLSGTPLYNGPIAVQFSVPVNAVGLSGGFFNAIGATTIEAYDANGNVLGSIVNSQLGIEFYGLRDSSNANVISGIAFYITGNEPAGFVIDNVTFGSAQQVVPEPGTLALLGLGLAMVVMCRRKRA